ncbi:MAG TPA: hypothetical protein VGE74_06040 [Gemmata sp.]
MPPPMTTCPKCRAEVPKKNFCLRCGENLVPKTWSDEVLDPLLFATAAKGMKESFEKLTLAKFQFISMPNDGTSPRIKPIIVDDQSWVFVAGSEGSPLQRLHPGRYEKFEHLFGDFGGAGQIKAQEGDNFTMYLKVPRRPVIAIIQLPDWQLLHGTGLVDEKCDVPPTSSDPVARTGQREDRAILLRKTLEQLNLLSADNLFGGAQVQLELQVVDPDKLLDTLGDSMIATGLKAKRRARTELRNNPVYEQVAKAPAKTWFGRRWADIKSLFVEEETRTRVKSSRSVTIDFAYHLGHFYERIQLEFRMAVQQAVRGFNAMDLLANRDQGREQVIATINQVMSDTLSGYGIRLNRCMTFEFVCPELLTLQREKGETKIAEERLKEQGERMKLNRQAALMTREEERADALLDFEDELTEIERDGVRSARKDANTAAAQVRQLDMDATQQEHARAQLAENERLAIALGKEKALADNDVTGAKRARELSEYQRQLQITGEHERQKSNQDQADFLAVLEAVGRLPPNLQQAALNMYQARLAATRPELAAMLASSQNSAGLEQQLARERELAARHSQELSAAHTQGTQQAVQLLASIVQQAGNVLVANAKPPLPPPPPPRSLPNSDPDRTEGGAQ